MKLFATILALAAVVAVRGECPNGCSAHGTCGEKDACTCYDNWMGGDCSQRVCPFGLAFVDTPVGDLNHDGSVSVRYVKTQWSNVPVSESWQGNSTNEAHYYVECSGKGVCDRSSGECQCYDGFSGSSCQRTTCPNDCSGHGQCFTLREIAEGPTTRKAHPSAASTYVGRNFRIEDYSYGIYSTSGVSASFDYNLWDADKNQACVCDSGFFGPDCSLRDCPRGDDPLTRDARYCGNAACTQEVQFVAFNQPGATASSVDFYFEWTDQEDYAGLLTALRSSISTVRDGLTGDQYAELVQDTLDSFPNGVMNGVTASCFQTYDGAALLSASTKCSTVLGNGDTSVVKIDFSSGPQGNINHLIAKAAEDVNYASAMGISSYYSASGSATELNLAGGYTPAGSVTTVTSAASILGSWFTTPYSTSVSNGNRENSPCSNRGLCDFASGSCQCFTGYTREDCSVQNALAGGSM